MEGAPFLVACSDPTPPLPLLHAVRWERTLIGGSPGDLHGGWGSPPPLHAVRLECTLLGGFPLLLLLVRGAPPFPHWHTVIWEHKLLFRGSPPSSGLDLHTVGAYGLSPLPSCPLAGCV